MAHKEKQPWNPYPLAVLDVEGLSRGAKHVLTVLAARSNYKGETCVGHRRLTKDCQSSKQYVTDGLNELYEKGIVRAAVRGRKKNQADWKTISPSVLKGRTESVSSPKEQRYNEEMKSYPIGLVSPNKQDCISECNPTRQGETLQITTTPNLADENLTEEKKVSESVSKSSAARAAALSVGAHAIVACIYPKTVPDGVDGLAPKLNALAAANPNTDWDEFFAWQRSHKPAPLVFRSVEKFLEGAEYALNDYARHDPESCRACRLKAKPGTHAYRNPELHAGLNREGNPPVGWKCTVCEMSMTPNKNRICDDCRNTMPFCGTCKTRHTDRMFCVEDAE